MPDLDLIKTLSPLGVGGLLAVVIFVFYGLDFLRERQNHVAERERQAAGAASVARQRARARGGSGAGDDLQGWDWITAEDLDLPTPRNTDVADNKAVAEGSGTGVVDAALSWLQHEALRLVLERRELRRRELIARCRVSREVARRASAGLVRLGLLRRIGLGRGARYVAFSWD